jgi:NTP pyrophosphatase (non-canonical NTP hydrolase)
MKIDIMAIFLKKAVRGQTMVHSNERYKQNLDSLADVLEDLMCYAAKEGKDFDTELANARRYYKQDTKGTPFEQ